MGPFDILIINILEKGLYKVPGWHWPLNSGDFVKSRAATTGRLCKVPTISGARGGEEVGKVGKWCGNQGRTE